MYSLTETVEGKLYLTQVRILKAPVKRKRTTRKYIYTLDNNGFLIKICKIKNLDCFFLRVAGRKHGNRNDSNRLYFSSVLILLNH